MSVDEIFTALSSHMTKGVMFHVQMSDYYDFLNLRGYKRCHQYRAKCEMKHLHKLHKYYINHYNRLIEEEPIQNPDVIPSSWYRYTRQDVDANTKRSAVKNGIEKWVSWETETKDLYEKMFKELMDLGEVSTANRMCCYIKGVDDELKWAERTHIDLLAADYDIEYILGKQDYLHDMYKERIHDKY